MPIYFRYLIIFMAAESFIPLSTPARINHQAQNENRIETTNPEDPLQFDKHEDEPVSYKEKYIDNLNNENKEHPYYSSQSISSFNEELDYEHREQSHSNEDSKPDNNLPTAKQELNQYQQDEKASPHASQSSRANEDLQPVNDLSRHHYRSSQTVSSAKQELNQYQQDEKDSPPTFYSSHTNEDSQRYNDFSEHSYHSSSSHTNKDLQPDNDASDSEQHYNYSQTISSSNPELDHHQQDERENHHIPISINRNEDSHSDKNASEHLYLPNQKVYPHQQSDNDVSKQLYHSTQSSGSSYQKSNHYPKDEKESPVSSSPSEYDLSNQDTSDRFHTENKKDQVINPKLRHKKFSNGPLVVDNANTRKGNKNLSHTENKNDHIINPKNNLNQFATRPLGVEVNTSIKKETEKKSYIETKNYDNINQKNDHKKNVINMLDIEDNANIRKENEKYYYTKNKNDHIINPKFHHKQLAKSPLVVDDIENYNKDISHSETYIEDVEIENEDTDYLGQSATSKSKELPSISECVEAIRDTMSNNFKKASTLSRATRSAERKTRSIIDHIMPYAIVSSTALQALSFIGPVLSLITTGALSLVDLAGYGISTAGSGMAIGAGLVSKAGDIVQRSSVAGPKMAAGVVTGGLALLFFSPYIFDIFSSLLVTFGLKMASSLAYGAKSFMKAGSTMDTVFEMGAVFAENLLEDYNHS